MEAPLRLDVARRQLLDTLARVDQLLTEAEGITLAARSHSPFNDYLTRLPDDATHAVAEGIAEVRSAMLLAVHQGGPVPEPHLNGVWAVRRTLCAAARMMDDLPAGAVPPVVGRIGVDPVGRMRQVFRELDRRLIGPAVAAGGGQ